ncbi:MAG TPA: ribulose-phosphate 3-epimerase [Candidatus Eisenbacteria bacterium]|nr:ribulose-phosphate 3-epimerase [Candidatus Eisenbacteria bacterium]
MSAHPLTPPIVAPSILSADFSRLQTDLALVDPERDWIHCDVMDNHFVPNLTFGPIVIDAVRKLSRGYLDVHLMIEEPGKLVPAFRKAGADGITIHLEACEDLAATLAAVKESGARIGLALKPGTPLAAAEPHLGDLDLLLLMTVEPGFGGQAFMSDMMPKVKEAVAWREQHAARYLIEVDGGIAPDTAKVARGAGAEIFVAGHAIYRQANPQIALATLRDAVR